MPLLYSLVRYPLVRVQAPEQECLLPSAFEPPYASAKHRGMVAASAPCIRYPAGDPSVGLPPAGAPSVGAPVGFLQRCQRVAPILQPCQCPTVRKGPSLASWFRRALVVWERYHETASGVARSWGAFLWAVCES